MFTAAGGAPLDTTMREIRSSRLAGGETGINWPSLPGPGDIMAGKMTIAQCWSRQNLWPRPS